MTGVAGAAQMSQNLCPPIVVVFHAVTSLTSQIAWALHNWCWYMRPNPVRPPCSHRPEWPAGCKFNLLALWHKTPCQQPLLTSHNLGGVQHTVHLPFNTVNTQNKCGCVISALFASHIPKIRSSKNLKMRKTQNFMTYLIPDLQYPQGRVKPQRWASCKIYMLYALFRLWQEWHIKAKMYIMLLDTLPRKSVDP